MTRCFGDRATFAVEIGKIESHALRVVDLWLAGKRLTVDDNSAFVPFFLRIMRSTAAEVRRRDVKPCPFPGRAPEQIFRLLHADDTEFREQFRFMQWGETVDNLSKYAYLDDDLVIVFQFWRATHPFPKDLGKVFVAKIPPDEFVATVEEAADLLDAEFVAVDPPR
ncbi:hypothetical protein ABZ422_16535 [Micromonospora zamorensis]|uniref:hypothetical protein n=1 Tax=Micromonospora zamorensis TaxID=709883 RepID=UPI00081FF271|nr:hypothetical protein [Micromonospora zamorensis]WSK51557.1 hypothetical protein OG423_14920 [Micromonospora zamorensis]SCG66125.1 hypothetical protein GA0070619_5301 [Micromonospora zamorensis]